MKTRTVLVLATLLLITVSASAAEPARAAGAALRDHSDKAVDLQDRYDRTPKFAYIFDGVEFPAGTPLPDVQLTWVITADDHKKGTFHVFSSHDVAKAFMKKHTRGVATDGARDRKTSPNWPGYCDWPGTYTRFEKSRNCGDFSYLTMYPPDGQFTELDSIGWNNTISCVYAACDWYWTVLYSCRNFDMQQSSSCESPDRGYIEGGVIIPDLSPYGWNNRTSSTRFE